MTVLADATTRVLVQGITGRQGAWSTADMRDYGTRVVAGVVPGRAGGTVDEIPVFDYVADAVQETKADASIVFVGPAAAAEAITEALEAGIKLVVYPGDGLPIQDAIMLRALADSLGATLLGANTPGLISPGQTKLGFMPSQCYTPGALGVVTKSGSLSYEVCWRLTQAGLGQSTVLGIGGDPVKGVRTREALALFDADPDTRAIVVLGEIGGLEEYDVAEYSKAAGAKPVAAFLVGRTAPAGRKLGHAGALIGSDREGYAAKAEALVAAGVEVVTTLGEIAATVGALVA